MFIFADIFIAVPAEAVFAEFTVLVAALWYVLLE
jgi:hypothetical protein